MIQGSALSGATAVHFGANAATSFSVVSSSEITATSPVGVPGSVDVTVTTSGGTSATNSSDRFSYLAGTPVVSYLSPSSGPSSGGTVVVIQGSALSGATAVHFGATLAKIDRDLSASQITVTAPMGSGRVDVTVTTRVGTSATTVADRFTYLAVPTVTKVSPDTGRNGGGTVVTIKGHNFENVTAVHFGTKLAKIDKRISASEIKAIAPQGSGSVDVTTTTRGGTSVKTRSDRYRY